MSIHSTFWSFGSASQYARCLSSFTGVIHEAYRLNALSESVAVYSVRVVNLYQGVR